MHAWCAGWLAGVAAELVFSSKKVLAMDFRHCQVLDPVGDAVAFPKFWKDRRNYQYDRRIWNFLDRP